MGSPPDVETAILRDLGICIASGTYSLTLLFFAYAAAFALYICACSLVISLATRGILRFLGDVREKSIGSGSTSSSSSAVTAIGVAPPISSSIDLLPYPGEPHPEMGEGNGVMSISGPTPGDDNAEPGVSESALCLEEKADRILELRTGRPALKTVWEVSEIGLLLTEDADSSRFLSFKCSVCNRSPALCGVVTWGDVIVGGDGDVVSRGWREALYWNGGGGESLGNGSREGLSSVAFSCSSGPLEEWANPRHWIPGAAGGWLDFAVDISFTTTLYRTSPTRINSIESQCEHVVDPVTRG